MMFGVIVFVVVWVAYVQIRKRAFHHYELQTADALERLLFGLIVVTVTWVVVVAFLHGLECIGVYQYLSATYQSDTLKP